MTILDTVRDIVADQACASLDPQSNPTFDDLELDPQDVIEIVMTVEDVLDIEFDDMWIDSSVTVTEFAQFVEGVAGA